MTAIIRIFRYLFYTTGLWCLTLPPTQAQELTETEAVQRAIENNPVIKSAESQTGYYRQIKKTSTDIGKLSAIWMRGQYNTIQNDYNLTLTQSIPFPGTMVANSRLGSAQITGAETNLLTIKNNLGYEVKTVFQTLIYQKASLSLLRSQDSLFTDFARASALRYKTGESNLLEKTTADTQLQEVKISVREAEAEVSILQSRLQSLLKATAPMDAAGPLTKRTFTIELSPVAWMENPYLRQTQQQVIIRQWEKRVERSRLLPDLSIGYFNQTLIGFQNTRGQEEYYDKSTRFQGFMLGLSIPLWVAPQLARARASSYLEEAARHSAASLQLKISTEYEQALRELDKSEASLTFYEDSALKNADLILQYGRKAYASGEIGYIEYLQALRNYFSIKSNYLKALNNYNLSVIKLEYLVGKN
jgi:heavy metal efflux system protein